MSERPESVIADAREPGATAAPRPLRRGWSRACAAAVVVIVAVLIPLALGTASGAGEKDVPLPPPADVQPWSAADLAARFPDPDLKAPETERVGVEACAACHEERVASLATSFHATLGGGETGCESCHGPGRAHSESDGIEPIRHPWDTPAEEMIGVCLRCHSDVVTEPKRGHRDWLTAAAGTPRACTACHEVHVDRSEPAHDPKTGPFATVAALDESAEPIPASRCIACHPGFHPEMSRSGHASLLEEGAQCGTCHGDGSLHEESGGRAELIVNPRRQTARDADRGCNTCHGGGAIVQRWTCSEHAKEGTSCVTCHDANAPRGRTLRAPEYTLCGGCHLDVKASFRLPNGHDVARGRVRCSDCHDPHENPRRVRDRDVRLRACAKCHAEKVGPFVHDHGIKRSEGCIACHSPHGSVNDRLLTFRRMKPQCLQCHPETPHDLSARRYDNCIACHIEIHGSDVDRMFLR